VLIRRAQAGKRRPLQPPAALLRPSRVMGGQACVLPVGCVPGYFGPMVEKTRPRLARLVMTITKALCWIALAILAMESQTGARAEDRVISTPSGGNVELYTEGAGPVILMIPSLGRGASDFDDLARRVTSAGFTAVRPEPRGIGKSIGPMSKITLHDLAADAAAVIESRPQAGRGGCACFRTTGRSHFGGR
jgi:hypothetical protein